MNLYSGQSQKKFDKSVGDTILPRAAIQVYFIVQDESNFFWSLKTLGIKTYTQANPKKVW